MSIVLSFSESRLLASIFASMLKSICCPWVNGRVRKRDGFVSVSQDTVWLLPRTEEALRLVMFYQLLSRCTNKTLALVTQHHMDRRYVHLWSERIYVDGHQRSRWAFLLMPPDMYIANMYDSGDWRRPLTTFGNGSKSLRLNGCVVSFYVDCFVNCRGYGIMPLHCWDENQFVGLRIQQAKSDQFYVSRRPDEESDGCLEMVGMYGPSLYRDLETEGEPGPLESASTDWWDALRLKQLPYHCQECYNEFLEGVDDYQFMSVESDYDSEHRSIDYESDSD